MPVNKDIIYPIFLECCKYTNDTYWENIFEDLAYGKSPYGTYISKDFLCCGYKKKDFSYKIEKKNTETLHNEVYNLLSNRLGLLSYKDKQKNRQIFTDIEDSINDSRKNWNDIKKKNIKELLIELYVTNMKNKHNLTIKQSKYLLSMIFIGLVFKIITSKDIEYKDGKIKNIEGIIFKHKKIIINKNLYQLENNITPNIIIDKKIMSDNWEKYLKELTKISI